MTSPHVLYLLAEHQTISFKHYRLSVKFQSTMKTIIPFSSVFLLSSRTVLAEWSIVNMSASATPHGSQSQYVESAHDTFEADPDSLTTTPPKQLLSDL